MSKNINRSWTLNAHPVGVPQLSDFRMIEQSIPEPLSREILVEVHYHSLDPYMRGRMNPPNRTAYTKGISQYFTFNEMDSLVFIPIFPSKVSFRKLSEQ